MTEPEKYNLQWDNFQNNMAECFKKFKTGNIMFDVTLVSDDNKSVSAHKLILSACSPFFQSILIQNTHSHPWIYLKGIKSSYLNLIIDFMYTGEIDIGAEDVENLFAIAKDLQVKGLTQDFSHLESKSSCPISENNNMDREKENTAVIRNEDPLSTDLASESTEIANVDPEAYGDVYGDMDYTNEGFPADKAQEEFTTGRGDKIKAVLVDMVHKTDGIWKCLVCQKPFKNKCMAMKHSEMHIEGVSISCEICKKSFRSSNSYQVHMSDYHNDGQEGMSYTCNICWKICKSKPALRMHNNRNHKQATS